MAAEHWSPTIRAAHEFRADIDAQNLYDAVVGKGADTRMVVEILTKRSNFQRQLIKAAYEHKYKQTLEESIKRVTKGDFEEIVTALLDPPDIYDAKMVHKSFSKTTSEVLLADILCTKSNEDIRRLQNAYRSVFGKSLAEELDKHTSGDVRKLIVPIANCERADDERTDAGRARADAEHLYKAGEKKLGTDEDVFQSIVGLRNPKQLLLIADEYKRLYGHSLEEAVEKEFSSVIKQAYLALLQSARDHHEYFARALTSSMKGVGTNDDRLMWLIVSRSEIDLAEIRSTFEKLNKQTLEKWVQGDTSGDYRNALLAILKGNRP